MKLRNLIFLPVLLPATGLAGTVVYTDSKHMPQNLSPDTTVVLVDGPDRLQDEFFGQLSADPRQAEAQARQMMNSPAWQQRQQQLTMSYRQVVHAWELGIKKIPAIVFDDQDVVYGTTDVAQALTLREQQGGGQ